MPDIRGKFKREKELDKRFYLPGITVENNCPFCGELCITDMDDSYLSYPRVGVPEHISMYCEKCDDYFSTYIIIDIVVSIAADG